MEYIYIILFLVILFLITLLIKIYNPFRQKKTYVIYITGAIATGKSTFINQFKIFLHGRGYKAYSEPELIITHKNIMRFLGQEKYSFTIQAYLMAHYRGFAERLNRLINEKVYDYILLDRSVDDTKYFALANIKEKEQLDFLEEEYRDVTKVQYDIAIYMRPPLETMIKYKEIRNRLEEANSSNEYFVLIYKIYEENIESIVNNYTTFDSSIPISEYEEFFKQVLNSLDASK